MAMFDSKRNRRELGAGNIAMTALLFFGLLMPLAVLHAAAPKSSRSGKSARTAAARTVLGYVGETSPDKRSLGGSGHAVAFQRPEGAKQLVAVQIYASRYGMPEPPKEDFFVYLLDKDLKVLKDFAIPYAKIERGPLQWYTLEVAATDVPERFSVALAFNPHQTKGVYLGLDKNVKESHSLIGLPDHGFKPVGDQYDWMIRACLTTENKTPKRK